MSRVTEALITIQQDALEALIRKTDGATHVVVHNPEGITGQDLSDILNSMGTRIIETVSAATKGVNDGKMDSDEATDLIARTVKACVHASFLAGARIGYQTGSVGTERAGGD